MIKVVLNDIEGITPSLPFVKNEYCAVTMSMKESEQRRAEWESRYQAGTTGWDRGMHSPALDAWLASGTLTPCRILVPGCGRGYEVVQLAQRGFEVTAVDIAPSAVQALRVALAAAGLSAQVMEADIFQWQPDGAFDAVYEQTCLCAIDPATRCEYAERLWTWLKPGGKLYVLFMQTGQPGGPPFHCELADMRALFPAERWAWPDETATRVPHPSREELHELGFILTRR